MSDGKALARRLLAEVFAAGRLATADELCAPLVAVEVKSAAARLRAPFPDLSFSIAQLIAEGSRVACVWRAHGTQTMAYNNVPPTGAAVAWSGCLLLDCDPTGRLVGFELISDTFAVLQQLRAALHR